MNKISDFHVSLDEELSIPIFEIQYSWYKTHRMKHVKHRLLRALTSTHHAQCNARIHHSVIRDTSVERLKPSTNNLKTEKEKGRIVEVEKL